ncbi:hypothetical protein JF723_25630, partial [Mycobacterium intracellulare]|nr:hypothetical protein [Mycobacterium intracellulare]
MSSGGIIDRDSISAAFDALDAAIEGVAGLSFDALAPRECLALLERCEKTRRRLPVAEHALITHLARQASIQELGGPLD